MQAEGNRICSIHRSDHETGAVSALELLVVRTVKTACICMYWLSVLRISAPEWMIYRVMYRGAVIYSFIHRGNKHN